MSENEPTPEEMQIGGLRGPGKSMMLWRELLEAAGLKVYTPEPITAEEMEAMIEQQNEAARATSTVYDFPAAEMTKEEWDKLRSITFRNGSRIVFSIEPSEWDIVGLEPPPEQPE